MSSNDADLPAVTEPTATVIAENVQEAVKADENKLEEEKGDIEEGTKPVLKSKKKRPVQEKGSDDNRMFALGVTAFLAFVIGVLIFWSSKKNRSDHSGLTKDNFGNVFLPNTAPPKSLSHPKNINQATIMPKQVVNFNWRQRNNIFATAREFGEEGLNFNWISGQMKSLGFLGMAVFNTLMSMMGYTYSFITWPVCILIAGLYSLYYCLTMSTRGYIEKSSDELWYAFWIVVRIIWLFASLLTIYLGVCGVMGLENYTWAAGFAESFVDSASSHFRVLLGV